MEQEQSLPLISCPTCTRQLTVCTSAVLKVAVSMMAAHIQAVFHQHPIHFIESKTNARQAQS